MNTLRTALSKSLGKSFAVRFVALSLLILSGCKTPPSEVSSELPSTDQGAIKEDNGDDQQQDQSSFNGSTSESLKGTLTGNSCSKPDYLLYYSPIGEIEKQNQCEDGTKASQQYEKLGEFYCLEGKEYQTILTRRGRLLRTEKCLSDMFSCDGIPHGTIQRIDEERITRFEVCPAGYSGDIRHTFERYRERECSDGQWLNLSIKYTENLISSDKSSCALVPPPPRDCEDNLKHGETRVTESKETREGLCPASQSGLVVQERKVFDTFRCEEGELKAVSKTFGDWEDQVRNCFNNCEGSHAHDSRWSEKDQEFRYEACPAKYVGEKKSVREITRHKLCQNGDTVVENTVFGDWQAASSTCEYVPSSCGDRAHLAKWSVNEARSRQSACAPNESGYVHESQNISINYLCDDGEVREVSRTESPFEEVRRECHLNCSNTFAHGETRTQSETELSNVSCAPGFSGLVTQARSVSKTLLCDNGQEKTIGTVYGDWAEQNRACHKNCTDTLAHGSTYDNLREERRTNTCPQGSLGQISEVRQVRDKFVCQEGEIQPLLPSDYGVWELEENRCVTIRVTDFVVNPRPQAPVDILFVVDHSGSMREEQKKMADRFPNFISSIQNLDWRIAITTTTVGSQLVQGSTEGIDGRLINFKTSPTTSSPFLTKSTPDMENLFKQTIQRKEEGSGDERAIFAANRSIERRNEHGFFRSKAHLALVIISDEDERSNGTNLQSLDLPETLTQNVTTLLRAPSFTAHSIVYRPGDRNCSKNGGAYEGKIYAKLTSMTKGVLGDICATDYGNQLSVIGQVTEEKTDSFDLPCAPVAPLVSFQPNPTTPVAFSWKDQTLTIQTPLPEGTRIRVEYTCEADRIQQARR